MHDLLQYPIDDDGNVFRQAELVIHGTQLRVSACTVQGSKDGITKKPNEDAYSVIVDNNKLIAAVFDGCSSLKPVTWLTDQTGARFASHFAKVQFEAMSEYAPSRVVTELNDKLREVSISQHGGAPSDVHSLPATTSTIVTIDLEHQKLSLNHLGDTFCVLYREDGTSNLVTIDKNEQYDQEIYAVITEIAKTKRITPREARQYSEVNAAARDMFQKTHNKPDGTGQGLLNGDPVAEKYIQIEMLPLKGVVAILIGSDGLVPPGIDEHSAIGQAKLLAVLRDGGLPALLKTKHEAEDGDPDWRHIRYKHSDDATGVYIELPEAT